MSDILHNFLKNKLLMIGTILILLFLVMAIFAPVIAPYDPYFMDGTVINQPPSAEHICGTDNFGRDIFSRIIFGSRISLQVSITAVTFSTVIGVFFGIVAGYYGGVIDNIISRTTDMMFSFPEILLALLVMSILGPSLNNITIAIAIVYTPIFARIARGATMNIKGSLYIEAARCIGVPDRTLIYRHILPNIMPPVIVQITLSLAFAILSEAALSFMGIGAEPDTPSWGIMLSDGNALMELYWWNSVFPGVAITLVVLAFNIMGDGLRDLIDPKIKNTK